LLESHLTIATDSDFVLTSQAVATSAFAYWQSCSL
jgi:hypothetical protein